MTDRETTYSKNTASSPQPRPAVYGQANSQRIERPKDSDVSLFSRDTGVTSPTSYNFSSRSLGSSPTPYNNTPSYGSSAAPYGNSSNTYGNTTTTYSGGNISSAGYQSQRQDGNFLLNQSSYGAGGGGGDGGQRRYAPDPYAKQESDPMAAFLSSVGDNPDYLRELRQPRKQPNSVPKPELMVCPPSQPVSRLPRQTAPEPAQDDMAAFLGSLGGNPGYLNELNSNKSPPQAKKPAAKNAPSGGNDDMAAFLGSMGGNSDYLNDLMK